MFQRPTHRLVCLLAVSALVTAVIPVGPAQASTPKPGRTGPTITLASGVQLDGYDVATNAAGTSFIGWIGTPQVIGGDRTANLCVLPLNASACQGGIFNSGSMDATTPTGLDESEAQGLRVHILPNGNPELVWFRTDVAQSESGPLGGRITGWDPLAGAPTDLETAPSFGSIFDSGLDPSGRLWVVAYANAADTHVEVTESTDASFTSFVSIASPDAGYQIGYAKLAFKGSTTDLLVSKAGSVTTPVAIAASSGGGGFGGFTPARSTWSKGYAPGLVGTSTGIRLLTTENNSNYYPVVSKISGASIGAPSLTGDKNNCSPDGHDAVTDASGRMADVTTECSNVTVTNFPDTLHGSESRFNAGGTLAGGDPQLATLPSGRATVVWSIESPGVGNTLQVAPFLLPGLDTTKTETSYAGRAIITGPVSCLPPVSIAIGLSAKPARGWHVVSRELDLGSHQAPAVLNGAALGSGSNHVLKATVVFASAAETHTVTTSLSFRRCGTP